MPLLSGLQAMLEGVRQQTERTVQNLDMHYLFLRVKLAQEQERCRVLQCQEELRR
jgi:hypothetical protein